MAAAIRQNMHYLMFALAQSNGMNGLSATSSHSVWLMTWWRGIYIALLVVFGLVTILGAAGYAVTAAKAKKDN
jgi:beta-glucosidase